MDVTLRKVTKDNYERVCELDVEKAQEDYVACNMWSLVEATYNNGYESRAIYLANEPVGFLMWVPESADKMSIWRFMIDQHYQKKGIGRKALSLALDEIQAVSMLKQIEICYHPENPVAKSFYASFGFNEVGMDEDNEDMIAVIEL